MKADYKKGPKLPVRPAYAPDPQTDQPRILPPPARRSGFADQPGLIARSMLGARVITRHEV